MNEIMEKEISIENMIYEVKGVEVMIDSDIAKLYHCKNGTKEINQAVKNNIEKFPDRFSWILSKEEENDLRSKFLTANKNSKSRSNTRVFTEQGLYMLATILKSDVATKVSIAIMDAFVKMRHYLNYNKVILPNRMLLLEYKVDENTKRINELFDIFDPKEIAKNYLFFENELFKSYYVLMKIFDSAKKEIIIIDNYFGKELLKILSEIDKKIIIISKNLNETLIEKYKQEYNNVEFKNINAFHDRFIIIDKKRLYSCGASLKDIGKKCFAINEMDDHLFLENILDVINL